MKHIWVVTDGKPGHQNQSLGLVDALAAQGVAVQMHLVPAVSGFNAGAALITGAVRTLFGDLPTAHPDLIITTGHRTHLTALALKRHFSAPLVVLMKPSLPLAWFDLCLIPHHDEPAQQDNIVATYGALNRMVGVSRDQKVGKPMLLLGGESKHTQWDEQAVIDQVKTVCAAYPQVLATTSRRTPSSTVNALEALALDNLELVPFEQTDANWLKERLPLAPVAWVTIDSVSMIYEALTAQCEVGVIELAPLLKGGKLKGAKQTPSRVIEGVQLLFKQELATPFSEFSRTGSLVASEQTFNEAARCAEIVKERFL